MEFCLVLTNTSLLLIDESGSTTRSVDLPDDAELLVQAHRSLAAGEPVKELSEILEGFRGTLVVEDDAVASAALKVWTGPVKVQFPSSGGRLVRGRGIAQRDRLREVAGRLASARIKESYENWDRLVVQAVGAVDEIDRSMANLYARCREWYGIHFPELERIVRGESQYSEVVLLEDLENIPESSSISQERRGRILSARGKTIGVELQEEDLEAVRQLAHSLIFLDERKAHIVAYLSRLLELNAPSLTRVAEAPVAARLIARAGSIRKLALMPSTSIQTLGAEKALFRHITKGARPPKHGIIFQHPYVRNSPKSIRGKVASVLASKISLAARTDYITGEDKGEQLKAALDVTVKGLRRKA